MTLLGELNVAVLVSAIAVGAGALRTATRHWRAAQVRRETLVWVESIGRAVTEERLRTLIEHGV